MNIAFALTLILSAQVIATSGNAYQADDFARTPDGKFLALTNIGHSTTLLAVTVDRLPEGKPDVRQLQFLVQHRNSEESPKPKAILVPFIQRSVLPSLRGD